MHSDDSDKINFMYRFSRFAYRRMLFGLCNALATLQICMMFIFSNMAASFLEVFMDDFSILGRILMLDLKT